jgi:hypothetical protein
MSDHSLNRQYDVYAAAREEYRQKIDEQADRIAQLEAALRQIAAFKADEYDMDWADTVAEMNSIARAALEERT